MKNYHVIVRSFCFVPRVNIEEKQYTQETDRFSIRQNTSIATLDVQLLSNQAFSHGSTGNNEELDSLTHYVGHHSLNQRSQLNYTVCGEAYSCVLA